MTIAQDLKQPVLPNYIELFIIDISPLGGPTLYLTPSTVNGGANISFGGQAYTPIPITGTGWETSINGQAPQPTIKVSNVNRFIQTYLTTYKDLVGVRITRYQTFDKYLDSGSSPDSTQTFNTCIYAIRQKTKQSKMEVEFKLSTVIDTPQLKLPSKQVLRTEFPGAGLFRKNGL
jgi:lambda family phage minor tail protein L